LQIESIADRTGAVHICAPTLQTLCQPRYATHLLKQLWSEAPTGAYSPTITKPSALIIGRNRQPKPLINR